MAPVKQIVVLRFKDPSKKEEAIEKGEAYWKWAFENEALKEHIHHQGVKVSADGNEHTCTFVFTDGGAMDKMTPLVMSYPKMDDIMWAREQYNELSNVYSISDEDKPALVAINEARKRVCTYNNDPVNLADFPAGHTWE